MIVALAIALILVSAFFMAFKPYQGFLLVLIAKPIVDMTWSFRPGGFSLIQVYAIIVPLLLMPRLIAHPFWKRKGNITWFMIGTLLFCAQILAVMPHFSRNAIQGTEVFFITLNVYLAFLLIPFFATSDKRLKQILVTVMLAAVIPIIISLYGEITGTVWRERTTVGLQRNIGLYHDAASVKHFGLQALLAAIMYYELYKPKNPLFRIGILITIALTLFMLYQSYTRGALVTVMAWFIIWAIMHKKIYQGLIAGLAAIGLNYVLDGRLSNDVMQLFTKEISYYSGELYDSRYLLNGRFFVWEDAFARWNDQGLMAKLFGGDNLGAWTHTEVLRWLMAHGIFGLTIYIVTMIYIIFWIVRNTLSFRNNTIMSYALMVLAMYLLEASGGVPGSYPQYMWFAFGIIGTCLINAEYLNLKNKQNRYSPREHSYSISLAE